MKIRKEICYKMLQALSISRSLFEAKKGKNICSELRRSVIESIEAAGGKIDYVEVEQLKTRLLGFFFSFLK